MFSRTDTLSQLETCMDCDSNVNDFLTQAPTLLLQTCVHTRKEPRKPSLSSGNRCRTVHSCDDVLTHEHCGGAATMLKSSDTKQLSRASRAVTPEGCSDVEASHHQPARAHGSSAGRSAHFWRRGRAAGAERSWKAAPAWCGNLREISTSTFSHGGPGTTVGVGVPALWIGAPAGVSAACGTDAHSTVQACGRTRTF